MESVMPAFVDMFYDAEFTCLHKNTTPISIGLVSGSGGSSFYAEFTDYDESQVTDWIRENVINHLRFRDKPDDYVKRTPMIQGVPYSPMYMIEMKGNTESIKSELMGWLANESHFNNGVQIRFFADCYAYDWVIMNDLIGLNGSALEIPSYVNYIPIDLSTALFLNNIDPDISREEFVGDYELQSIRQWATNIGLGSDSKHNCLWDAMVCRQCFRKIPCKNNIRN